jgi:hypothetical protein
MNESLSTIELLTAGFQNLANQALVYLPKIVAAVVVLLLGRLLKASHRLRLKDIMVRKTRSISAYAKADTLLKHPGWSERRSLPVVDRDNALVGALAYIRLKDSLGAIDDTPPPDAMASLLSFAGLYWFTMARLIDSVFSITGVNRGERS